jgi:chaperone required for assembly of F1-ATPase
MSDPSDNPVPAGPRLARSALPKRFYRNVTVALGEGGFSVLLDGRGAKTPGRRPLATASRAVAEAIAAEWEAQPEVIDPAAMPLTRLANAAIDRVANDMNAVRAEIVKYAGTDAICYRAEGPAGLVAAQDRCWSPLVHWAKSALRARLSLAAGIVHVPQDPTVTDTVRAAIEPLGALALAALHVVTTLAGSAIIALALQRGRITPEQAWEAAHVDEDWQMAQWGADDIALTRRAARRREFDAAALVLAAE